MSLRVFTRMTKWMVVMVLTFSLGLHWAVLQSVAWVGMTVSYSRATSLGDALVKTFDGKHPCKLCKFVAEGKASEKKSESREAATKIELCLSDKLLPLLPVELAGLPSLPVHVPAARGDAPPLPPPRFLTC